MAHFSAEDISRMKELERARFERIQTQGATLEQHRYESGLQLNRHERRKEAVIRRKS
jgi:hypothetical protein